ncbi:MAG: tRNA uridine-5-carboxymethylaminomethyl(34) synthesis enzyme MnmG [Candidatus Omnitrophota bacterium]
MQAFLYDVIVVGGGHAGIEAAWAAAKLGGSVLLLTIDIDAIGKLSCNPAVGGIAKGHLVREVDALGGLIGRIADECAIGYRVLNKSKGKAVWATRAQVDRFKYQQIARKFLEGSENIRIIGGMVSEIKVKAGKVHSVITNFNEIFKAKAVILCPGTFLKSTIHIGLSSFSGGRLYESSSDALFTVLKKLKIKTRHFKTGTCARLNKHTIDFSKMAEQPPDLEAEPFSFSNKNIISRQLSCYITHTNSKTHSIIRRNLKYSPLYTGKIRSRGVRYCPSIEDKIIRFPDKNSHQVFIEPEGRDSIEIYPNGISTSLPFKVQADFIRTIKGLENAQILRPGYGIEHGVIDSTQLYPTFETKHIKGLYFAGQVNGTTGYEEAAAQGLVAGVNAVLSNKKKNSFIAKRHDSFIGVLADDLTAKGTDEPYRMFTSRCEFRLSVRENNADSRLMPLGYNIGLVAKADYERFKSKKKNIESALSELKSTKITLNGKKTSLAGFLKQPCRSIHDIKCYLTSNKYDNAVLTEAEINIKYEGFLRREDVWNRELKNLEKVKVPPFDFLKIPSLSKEVREKLDKFKPKTLKDALDISGITPAAILALYSHIKKNRQSVTRYISR